MGKVRSRSARLWVANIERRTGLLQKRWKPERPRPKGLVRSMTARWRSHLPKVNHEPRRYYNSLRWPVLCSNCRAYRLGVAAMTWQPIETAPKDETSIDVWVESHGIAYRIADVWWNPDDTMPLGGCWWDKDADYGDGGPLTGVPTHWMPLPAPPEPS